MVLQRIGRTSRGIVTPQSVDQPVGGNYPAGVQCEQRQGSALPHTADVDPVITLVHLERAEQADSHASITAVPAPLVSWRPYPNRPVCRERGAGVEMRWRLEPAPWRIERRKLPVTGVTGSSG